MSSLEWHPTERKFASHSGGSRIDIFELKAVRAPGEKEYDQSFIDISTPVSCFQWAAAPITAPLMAVGTSAGSVSLIDWTRKTDVEIAAIYEPAVAAAKRPCTGVSWNWRSPQLLAGGFEKARSAGEFCVAVWNLEYGGKLVYRPPPEVSEPTASLCWLPHDPHVLAVGTSISWVRLYDTRVKPGASASVAVAAAANANSNAPPPAVPSSSASVTSAGGLSHSVGTGTAMGASYSAAGAASGAAGTDILSVMAHAATRPRKVKGIRPDPLQPHTIATFSDSPGEPIKVWDLRNLKGVGAASKPKIMVAPGQAPTQMSAVLDVAWSPTRAGVLAVATNTNRGVSFYSTNRPANETITRMPILSVAVNDLVRAICWGSQGAATDSPQSSKLHKNNRLLISTTTGFADVLVTESTGLGIGADGVVAVGSSELSVIENLPFHRMGAAAAAADSSIARAEASGESEDQEKNKPKDKTTDSSSELTKKESLSEADYHLRAEVSHDFALRSVAGYSLDSPRNMQVLSEEIDGVLAARSAVSTHALSPVPWKAYGPENGVLSLDTDTSTDAVALSMKLSHLQKVARLWAWVDRVESLSQTQALSPQPGAETPLSLASCGILHLLSGSGSGSSNAMSSTSSTNQGASRSAMGAARSVSQMHPLLGVAAYTSEQRRLARELCGWIPENGDGRALSGEESSGLHSDGADASDGEESEDDGNPEDDNSDDGANGDSGEGGAGTGGKKSKSKRRAREAAEVPLSELEALVVTIASEGDNDNESVTDGDMPSAVTKDTEASTSTSTDGNAGLERAAALALFHGDLALAVRVLQRDVKGLELHKPAAGGDMNGHSHTSGNDMMLLSSHYQQTISLVAMCIAGYYNGNIVEPQATGSATASASASASAASAAAQKHAASSIAKASKQKMWKSMCEHVIAQLESFDSARSDVSSGSVSSSCGYLQASLRFLLSTLTVGTAYNGDAAEKDLDFGCIIDDERLLFEDRVAFAATYLDDSAALSWLRRMRDRCTYQGDLAGLVLTGLSNDGINLLQNYLDLSDDLQTVALLVARQVMDSESEGAAPAASSTSSSAAADSSTSGKAQSSASEKDAVKVKSRESQWLYEYRALLNKLGLFIPRANLDCELGRYCRSIAASKPAKSGAMSGGVGGAGPAGAGAGAAGSSVAGMRPGAANPLRRNMAGTVGGAAGSQMDRKTGAARLLYQLPPNSDMSHVFLRCNYCQSSLPSDPLQNQHNAFFRKAKPLINCCSCCKKPLPRCFVCNLHLGLVNPTFELNRALQLSRKSQSNAQSGSSSDPAGASRADNMLAFGNWVHFCQHCHHGGHSSCIAAWFSDGGVGVGMTASGEIIGRDVCGVNGCNCRCKALS